MRITSRGQVTIPIEIRERTGLFPHTAVRFEVEGDAVRILRDEQPHGGRGEKLLVQLRGREAAGSDRAGGELKVGGGVGFAADEEQVRWWLDAAGDLDAGLN